MRLRFDSRGILLAALVLLPIIGVLTYAGPACGVVCYRLLSDGVVLLLWLGAAMGFGRLVLGVTRSWDRNLPNALRWVLAAALGLGIMSLLILGLGLSGGLNAISAWMIVIAGIVAASYAVAIREQRSDAAPLRDWLKDRAGWEWLWVIAAPFMALSITAAMVPPGMLWNPEEPHGYDVAEYHLQIPREWYEAHRIVPLHHNVFSYFPFNVEMHYLLAMHLRGGPWVGMYLAQLMHAAFMALTVIAVYGLARRSAPPGPAMVAAQSMLTVPWLTQLAGIAYDEGGFLLYGTLAIGFALSASLESKRRLQRFAIAGAMAGFAAGSKLTAVPEVILAIPVASTMTWVWIRLEPFKKLAGRRPVPIGSALTDAPSPVASPLYSVERVRRGLAKSRNSRANGPSPQPSPPSTGERGQENPAEPRRIPWAGAIVFLSFALLCFSPWMLRNVAWTGNPVFPALTPLLGKGDFTDAQIDRWEMAHKAPSAERSRQAQIAKLWREVALGWQFGYLLLPLALIAFVFSVRRPQAWYLLTCLAVLTLFWLLFTHLQGRFFILAAPIGALMLVQYNWRRGAPAVAILVAIFTATAWWRIHARLVDRLNGTGTGEVRFVNALGLEDLSWLALQNITPDGLPSNAKLVLVGEARAFWYPLPMSRLSYRTVFDVKGDGDDLLRAWGGSAVNEPGVWIVVNAQEIKRLAKSYYGLPVVPDEVQRQEGIYLIKR